MARRDHTEAFDSRPPWQRRVLTYLGLSPHPSPPAPRPTWRRVLAAVAATILAAATVIALVESRWVVAALRLFLTVVVALDTRRQPLGRPL